MASVTSTDTGSGSTTKAAVARHAGTAVLGYLVPWSTPARAVATRVIRRKGSHVSVPTPTSSRFRAARSVSTPARRRRTPRISPRTGFVLLGLGGVVAGGVAFSALRRSRHTPPPVAAHPPRVEDVPTR